MSEPEVLVEVTDGIGRLRLNRPRAINALTLGMIRTIAAALDDFAGDGRVRAVEITGAGERGLCAGADIRAMRELVLRGDDPMPFFTEEYAVNRRILTYPKPYRAIMAGVTMGGGLGLSAHGSDRVVTPSSRLAMPETQIGLFPDVLMSWHLAWMPAEVGTHLALTGSAFNAADALWLRLADRCDGLLPQSQLQDDHNWIAACYPGDDAAEIVGRLAEHAHPRARETAALLRTRSPLSVCVTLEAVRRARRMPTLPPLIEQELSLAEALVTGPDFAEGVRAQIVDKDRNPRWQHDRIEDVGRAEVLACFPDQPA